MQVQGVHHREQALHARLASSKDTHMLTREQWQMLEEPVTGPGYAQPVTATFVHWEGISRSEPIRDLGAWCRSGQHYYLTERGYSLGYNYAVASGGPQDGLAAEIRGTSIQNAANKGGEHGWTYNTNHYSRSIIVLGRTNHPMTAAAMATIEQLATGTINGHRDCAFTVCPGDIYYSQLDDIGTQPEPLPPPGGQPPMAKEIAWVFTHATIKGAYWVSSGSVVHLDAPMRDHLINNGVPHHISHNDDVAMSYRRIAQGK